MEKSPMRLTFIGVGDSALALIAIVIPSPAGATGASKNGVSVTTTGTQEHGGSYFSAISADGRFVAFESAASDLVPEDTNGSDDIFVTGPLS